VTARRRVTAFVALLAAVAVAIVAFTVVSSGENSAASTATSTKPRAGRPPLSLALGFRTDREAQALARAAALYSTGRLQPAESIFNRYDSLEARVGAAFATWPRGTVDRLEELANLYPKSALVELHLGLAQLWAAQGDPTTSWRSAVDDDPDSPYAVLSGNLLHPELPRGLPAFIPSFSAPSSVTSLPAARQLVALRLRAQQGGAGDWILYGVGLQRVGRPLSARRAFERAAQLAPRNVEARVAAAVGQFDKDDPTPAFAQLGPLTRVFPKEPTVRFHLGVLLLWTGRIKAAEHQLRLASRIQPGSLMANEAARYLETIRRARSR
jgi:tetratricopeptide (TPR) repeat protein